MESEGEMDAEEVAVGEIVAAIEEDLAGATVEEIPAATEEEIPAASEEEIAAAAAEVVAPADSKAAGEGDSSQTVLSKLKRMKRNVKDAASIIAEALATVEEVAETVKVKWIERESEFQIVRQKLDMMIMVRDETLGASSERSYFERERSTREFQIEELLEKNQALKDLRDLLAGEE